MKSENMKRENLFGCSEGRSTPIIGKDELVAFATLFPLHLTRCCKMLFGCQKISLRNVIPMRVLVVFSVLILASSAQEVLFEWTTVDYDWTYMGESRQEWIDNGLYIAENCAVSGIKVWNEVTYVTVPRWRPGVPGTLNTVHVNQEGVPLLRPYPDLRSQNISNPNSIAYVQSMEIDPSGMMWIVDSGILNLFTPNQYEFRRPRLLKLDLASGSFLQEWDLSSVVIVNVSFLNDIVIDVQNGYAYMTDAGGDGGLIVVDLKETSVMRRFEGESTMAVPSTSGKYRICNDILELGPTPSDGIALDPTGSRLYYSPLIGYSLYSINATIFRDMSQPIANVQQSVVNHGEKLGMTDGMAMTASGILYFGNLNECAIHYWDTANQVLTPTNQHYLQVPDSKLSNWPDTFGFDNKGSLVVVANRLGKFLAGITDWTGHSGFNYRVNSYFISDYSYMTTN
jgi:sugar lactone lactonase YvrE